MGRAAGKVALVTGGAVPRYACWRGLLGMAGWRNRSIFASRGLRPVYPPVSDAGGGEGTRL